MRSPWEHAWAVEERGNILRAGLQVDAPKQMDATGNRQKGVNKVTHIITAPFIETARKLNISAYNFIYDRITQQFKLSSLARSFIQNLPGLFEPTPKNAILC